MPSEDLVLRLKSEGGARAAADVAKVAEAFRQVSKDAASTNSATIALAKTLGGSFGQAQQFAKTLGLSADVAAQAAQRFNELRDAGANSTEAFEAINREIGITKVQFQELNKVASNPFKDLNLDGAVDDFERVRSEIEKTTLAQQQLEREQELIGQGFEAIALGAGAIAGTIGLLGANALQTSAKFESLNAALANTLGSESAAEATFARIQEFASKTPFQVDALTESFLKLANRGFVPTNEELTRLGDLASSQAKDFDQLVEALLDAQTGEFERLKEFGIQAKVVGDNVQVSFRGVTQEIERTPEAIQAAILGFGELDGITGSLATQSATLTGQFSNLQDGLDQISKKAGDFAAEGAGALLQAANGLVGAFLALPAPLQNVVFSLTGLTAVLATAIAALAAYNVAQRSGTVEAVALAAAQIRSNATTAAKTAQTIAATAAQLSYAAATGRATAAQALQIQQFAAGAARLGLFAAALGAIALNVASFQAITSAASETQSGIDELDKATADYFETLSQASNLPEGGLDAIGTSAEKNKQILEDSIPAFQKFIDKVIEVYDATTPGDLATGTEAAVNRQIVAFGDLIETIDNDVVAAFDRLNAAPGGLEAIPTDQLEAYTNQVEVAIATLEKERPITEANVQSKEIYLDALRRIQGQLEATTAATGAGADATEKDTEAIKRQTDALKEQLEETKRLNAEQQADNERQISRTNEDQEIARERALAEEIAQIQSESEAAIAEQKKADAAELAEIQKQQAAELAEIQRGQAAELQELQRQAQEAEAAIAEQQQEELQSRQDAFNRSQELAEQQFQESLQADEQAFNEAQNAAREAFDQRQGAAQTGVDRQLQLEFADSDQERARLEAAFEREDAIAKRRAELEAPLRQAEADFEQQQQAAQAKFEDDQRVKQAEFDKDQQAVQTAFEAQQLEVRAAQEQQLQEIRIANEAAIAQVRADQEIALTGVREQQEIALTSIREQQEQRLTAQKVAAEEAIALLKSNAADAERTLDRQFEDAKIERERAFKEEQRRLDLANAQAIANLQTSSPAASSPSSNVGGRRKGGRVEAHTPYWVGEGEGGRILPTSEIIVPDRPGYVLDAKTAQRTVEHAIASEIRSIITAKTSTSTAHLIERSLISREAFRIAPQGAIAVQVSASSADNKAVVQAINALRSDLKSFRRPEQYFNFAQAPDGHDMDRVLKLMKAAL